MGLAHSYELMVITDPELGEEATEALQERITHLISQQGGELKSTDPWGKRRLAYAIDGRAEGVYTLWTFESSEHVPAELSRQLRLTEGVLRHMIVRKDGE